MAPSDSLHPATHGDGGESELVIRPQASLHMQLDVSCSNRDDITTKDPGSVCGSSSTAPTTTQTRVNPEHVPDVSNHLLELSYKPFG